MARNFDGVNDDIDFGAKSIFKITGDLSWAIWLKLNSSTPDFSGLGIIEGDASENENKNGILFVDVRGSSGNWDIRYVHEFGAGTNELFTFDTNIGNDIWTHLAIVRDVSANTVKCYIDGVLHSTFNYTNDPTNTGTTVTYILGNRIDSTKDLNGELAEAVLSNVVWSDNEVKTIQYRASRARGIVHYAPLYGADSPEPDYSGNTNNGTVTGTTQIDHPPVAVPFGFDIGWMGAFVEAPVGQELLREYPRGINRGILRGVL